MLSEILKFVFSVIFDVLVHCELWMWSNHSWVIECCSQNPLLLHITVLFTNYCHQTEFFALEVFELDPKETEGCNFFRHSTSKVSIFTTSWATRMYCDKALICLYLLVVELELRTLSGDVMPFQSITIECSSTVVCKCLFSSLTYYSRVAVSTGFM